LDDAAGYARAYANNIAGKINIVERRETPLRYDPVAARGRREKYIIADWKSNRGWRAFIIQPFVR